MAHSTGKVLLFRLGERLRMSLWFVPAVAVATAIGLAAVLVPLDRAFDVEGPRWLLFSGGPESARNLLTVIAGSMITSISLIFSVTMVVLQLASAQYSPRVLRSFIRDRLVQSVLGVYIATFAYCLVVLPAVRSAVDGGNDEFFVPSLAVTAALLMALGSLALFVRYVHHMAHAIRASTIISTVAQETREALERMYPEEIGEEAEQAAAPSGPPRSSIAWEGRPGILVAVDEDTLIEVACRAETVIEVVPMVGSFVPTGIEVFRVRGPAPDEPAVAACITIDDDRTMHQDPAFGFRQLVDVAERALSPGVNDPTTAVQAIDQLHDLLRRLARRRIPSPLRLGPDGALRVVAPRLGWDEYVHLAFDEIRHYSGRSIQVTRRLSGAVDDLLSVASTARREALEFQRALLNAASDREFDDASDRLRATDGTLIT